MWAIWNHRNDVIFKYLRCHPVLFLSNRNIYYQIINSNNQVLQALTLQVCTKTNRHIRKLSIEFLLRSISLNGILIRQDLRMLNQLPPIAFAGIEEVSSITSMENLSETIQYSEQKRWQS